MWYENQQLIFLNASSGSNILCFPFSRLFFSLLRIQYMYEYLQMKEIVLFEWKRNNEIDGVFLQLKQVCKIYLYGLYVKLCMMYAHITYILHVRWQNIGNFVLYEFLRVIICITMHSNGLSRIFHFMSWLHIVYPKQFVCYSKNIVQYYNFNCNICKFASILCRNVSQSFIKLLQFSLNFFCNFSSKNPLFAMFSVF